VGQRPGCAIVCVCVCAYIYVCVCVCMYVCVRACVYMCVCVRVCVLWVSGAYQVGLMGKCLALSLPNVHVGVWR